MDQATTWKKYSPVSLGCWIMLCVSCCLAGRLHALTPIESMKKPIPRLQDVGIVPIQWQTSDSSFQFRKLQKSIEKIWSQIPVESKRFELINFDVSSELWQNPEGRKELVNLYEMDGLISLTATSSHDVYVFTTRLLSPDLEKTYILESDTLSKAWLFSAVEEQIHDKLSNLAFRMINRLPMDAYVTSIQGQFVTLSAGSEQNLKVGDEFEVKRYYVKDTHPATGVWLNFQHLVLGKVRVIDTKPHASIAQMLASTFEGSIKIGDGVKLDELPSRIAFKRLIPKPDFVDKEFESPIIYPPPPAPEKLEKVMAQANAVVASKFTKAPEQEQQEQQQQQEEEQEQLQQQESDADQEQSDLESYESNPALKMDHDPRLFVDFGPRFWNVSGGSGISAKSKLPAWILSSFGFQYGESLGPDMGWDALGAINMGDTSNGSYSGFGIGGRFFYRLKLGPIAHLRPGLKLAYESLGATPETFGGEDLIKIVPFFEYFDMSPFEPLGSNLKYTMGIDFSPGFLPFAFGQIGIPDGKVSLDQYDAYHLYAGVTIQTTKDSLEWGGKLLYGTENYHISVNNEEVKLAKSDLYVAATVGVPL